MKERPVLFSAPMVRALLDGRKTQTRRVIKGLEDARDNIEIEFDGEDWIVEGDSPTNYDGDVQMNDFRDAIRCPYGVPGDMLRVKEASWMWCERRPNGTTKTGRQKWHYVPMRDAPIHYVADDNGKPTTNVVSPDTGNKWLWRHKVARFMPSWASRITLLVTDVRVEHLQSISFTDAKAEGTIYEKGYTDPRDAFRVLWESINGAGSWQENPFVWVITFQRLLTIAGAR